MRAAAGAASTGPARAGRWVAAHRRRVSILLGALLGLPTAVAASGPLLPLDRAIVSMPPIYPAPSGGFLRLPETRSTPIGPVEDPVLRGAPARSGPAGGRPTRTHSRLEPAVGIDARGRVITILEYTPGRFDR